MGFFFQGYSISTILTLIVLIIILVLLNEITRRSKIISIIAYCLLPIILVILIALNVVSSPSSKTWFGVVKTFSALAGVLGFMLIRFTKLGNTKFTWYFPLLILVINIIEAIIRDFEVYSTYKVLTTDAAGVTILGGPWNIINAIAGIFLLLTLTGWMKIQVAKTPSKDMVWPDQLWFWIIAYDLWNLAYCYNCISTRAMYAGFALIASCTIAAFAFKKGAWLQHRAQTLALFGMFSLAFDYQASPLFAIEATYNPNAWMALSIIALIFNLCVFVYEIYVIIHYHRNPLKQELYVHLSEHTENLKANNLL